MKITKRQLKRIVREAILLQRSSLIRESGGDPEATIQAVLEMVYDGEINGADQIVMKCQELAAEMGTERSINNIIKRVMDEVVASGF